MDWATTPSIAICSKRKLNGSFSHQWKLHLSADSAAPCSLSSSLGWVKSPRFFVAILTTMSQWWEVGELLRHSRESSIQLSTSQTHFFLPRWKILAKRYRKVCQHRQLAWLCMHSVMPCHDPISMPKEGVELSLSLSLFLASAEFISCLNFTPYPTTAIHSKGISCQVSRSRAQENARC